MKSDLASVSSVGVSEGLWSGWDGQQAASSEPKVLEYAEYSDGENPEDALDAEQILPLTEHLEELRRRIISCLVFWVLSSSVAYYFCQPILEGIRLLAGSGFTFVYTSPGEAFIAFIKLAMTVGLVVSLPVLIFHVVRFLSPGLTRRERRWLNTLVPFSILLFLAGCLFAWFVALPIMWRFFLGFQSAGIQALWTIGEVVGFVVGLLLLCGVVFQLPLVVIFAALAGLVNSSSLRRYRKLIYFSAFALAAIVTPTPDAFTACVVALPVIALFELSLVVIRVMKR